MWKTLFARCALFTFCLIVGFTGLHRLARVHKSAPPLPLKTRDLIHNSGQDVVQLKIRAPESRHDVNSVTNAPASSAVPASASPHAAIKLQFHSLMARARDLARSRKYPEAVATYLEAFESGTHDASLAGTRCSFLTQEIARLAGEYPPALDTLIQLRRSAEQRLHTSAIDTSAAIEFAAINRALHTESETLAYYDRLNQGDPRRSTLTPLVYDLLIEAKRYTDAALAMPADSAIVKFKKEFSSHPLRINDGAATAIQARAILVAAKYVEAFAGSGNTAGARALVESIVQANPSEATKDLLRAHLERAGRTDLSPK